MSSNNYYSEEESRITKIENLIKIKCIGKGNFGRVFLTIDENLKDDFIVIKRFS